MLYLTPSATQPGHWWLGERELTPGDVIEIWVLGRWYTAQVEYSAELHEQRLRIAGYPDSQPFTTGTPARWSETGTDRKHTTESEPRPPHHDQAR